MKMSAQNKNAISTVEYLFFITLILFTLVAFQRYMANGLNGMWKRTGDSFGMGRQYDPNATIECGFDITTNKWYDALCLQSFRCPAADKVCEKRWIAYCISTPNDCD